MKQPEKISENKNYTAINVGSLDDIKSYTLFHQKLGTEVKGKLMLNELTKATGTEISFTTIPPRQKLGYFHIHYKGEETYIILKGEGYYQVDDDCFPIKEGSVIRIHPEGVRSLCNTSNEDMVYLCIQSTMNSLGKHSANDGERVQYKSILKDYLPK